jgi:excisionase family DNA binding protein
VELALELGRFLEAVIERKVREAVAPLRADLERLRAGASDGFVTQDEAARRLGLRRRSIQRYLQDGRLEAVVIGSRKMVRWPPYLDPRLGGARYVEPRDGSSAPGWRGGAKMP